MSFESSLYILGMNPLSDVCFANNIPSLCFFILLKVLCRAIDFNFLWSSIYQFFLLQTGLWCLFVMCLGLDFVRVILYGVHSASSMLYFTDFGSFEDYFFNSSFSYILFSFGNSEEKNVGFLFSPSGIWDSLYFVLNPFCFSSSDMVNSIDQSSTLLILSSVISTLLLSPCGKFCIVFSSSIISIFCNFHLFSEILFFTFFSVNV